MLKKGSKGEEVKELQRRLIMEGYNCGSSGADGDFGEGTYNAVKRFQQEVGLTPDGIVGDQTWKALIAITGENGNQFLLKRGDKGESVRMLQQKLIARGYSCGSSGADGDYGDGTYNAVCKFQSDHGLEVDGISGPITLSAINGSAGCTVLRKGNKGALVKELQEKLIAKGYSCGSSGADGDFGQATYNAVVNFQTSNGLEVDGIVGPRTWDALNGLQYNSLLRIGSKGNAVRELQEKLITKGYSVGNTGVDGDFGYATYEAVVNFQRDHGLDTDGIVGPSTWSALYNSVSKGSAVSGGKGVARFLEVARAEIGTREQYDNITKYGAWFNNNGQYWCAQFVSWCAAQAGILGTIVPCYENCKLGANWYRAKGRYRTRLSGYVPFPGDIIFFTNSNNFYYHTGIVEFVKDGVVHTIEGNSNDCVRRVEYSIIDSKINGYGVNGGIISPINNANDKLEAKQTLYIVIQYDFIT